ncbi:hypothetical protein FB451DRAFT_1273495 [Mycena latifolia]|nr:hypothetical protein FB451DRAFT_1273495 [Mycena latifolia]
MENLPAELHLKIYKSACRDDGRTGSALSLVSKRIRELSAEHRYQSIAVCGPIQIQRLVDCLRVVPPEFRRIRFLFIYDYSSLSRIHRDVTACDGPPPTSRARFSGVDRFEAPLLELDRLIAHMTSFDLFDNDWDRMVHRCARTVGRNILEILALAHETVELLSLICFDHKFDGGASLRLWQENCPVLTHLTVRGPHELPNDPSFAPLLRTLHATDTALPEGFSATLAANHPSLSRIRISRALHLDTRDKDILGIIYAMRIASGPNMPQRMSEGAKRLFILEPNTPHWPSNHYLRILEALKKLDTRHIAFRLMPSHPGHKMGQEAKLALEDWISSAKGGAVKWGEAPRKLAWDVDFFDA